MERREFLQACSVAACAGSFALPAEGVTAKRYAAARLVDSAGQPIKAASLVGDRAYIFHYPFVATPCFLLDLGKAVAPQTVKTTDGPSYAWSGGVGVNRSIVAYSAICSHRLTYPTREITFIGYRRVATPHSAHANVIHCCSEHSQYDPAAGARVLEGPAPRPLAAVLLEHDPKTDGLTAIGTLGPEMFGEFFAKYEFKLTLEHAGRARAASGATVALAELTSYCRQQVRC